LAEAAAAAEQEAELVEEAKDQVAEIDAIYALDTVTEAVDKVEAALPLVKDLATSDAEMDELADLAKNTFNDLMELGMNVDVRSSGRIFEVAATMLGHSITAKTAKLDKKLAIINLQLRKQKLQQDGGNGQPITGTGTAMTRNELLDQVLKRVKEDAQKAK
jgi:hypothetical protein